MHELKNKDSVQDNSFLLFKIFAYSSYLFLITVLVKQEDYQNKEINNIKNKVNKLCFH